MPRTPVATTTIPVVDSTGRPIRCGQRVRVHKHARIYGTKDERLYTWGAYTVTVRDAVDGTEPDENTGDPGLEPRVTWSGGGGYFHEAPSRQTTLIDD
jgi:hypothetical protein